MVSLENYLQLKLGLAVCLPHLLVIDCVGVVSDADTERFIALIYLKLPSLLLYKSQFSMDTERMILDL